MPVFENRVVLELTRKIRLFLNVEAGITGMGETLRAARSPGSEGTPARRSTTPGQGESKTPAQGQRQAAQQHKLKQARQQLAVKDQRIAQLQEKLATADPSRSETGGVKPENLIWIFGVARTGSSWLSAMMKDVEGHARWNEPYVGDVFGYAYFVRAWDWQRERPDYILGDRYKSVWLRSIRTFVFEGAKARLPGIKEDGYVVIKEPNGSIGAPLLMEALPESRVIFLVRDPRDVVASMLAAQKKDSWGVKVTKANNSDNASADDSPDEFVKVRSHLYMASLEKAREAYEAHRGYKVAVRYEDLRYNTLDELRRIYIELDVPVEEKSLQRIVKKHAWENVPEENKGPDKPRRKATPGGWQEDLTPEQAKTVEEITGSVLAEFYSKESGRVGPG